MRALLSVLLAAPLLGCGETETARVVCLDIGVAEGRHPCEVALLLENEGGAAAEVIAADLPVGWKYLLFSGDPAAAPDGLDYEVSLRKVNPLAAGQVNSLVLAVEWSTPPGVEPMAAIVHTPGVEVTLGSGQVVTSRPMTFLLTSEPGLAFARPGPSAELHRKLRELPGGTSPAVEEVMRAVRVEEIQQGW